MRGVALYHGDRRGGAMRKWTWGLSRGLRAVGSRAYKIGVGRQVEKMGVLGNSQGRRV